MKIEDIDKRIEHLRAVQEQARRNFFAITGGIAELERVKKLMEQKEDEPEATDTTEIGGKE